MLRERKSLYTTFIFVVYAVKVVHNIGRLNISQLLRVLVLTRKKETTSAEYQDSTHRFSSYKKASSNHKILVYINST